MIIVGATCTSIRHGNVDTTTESKKGNVELIN